MDKRSEKHQTGYQPEAGEEKIAFLIKKAGETAREQKKKMLEGHLRKIHLAVTGRLEVLEKDKSS